ncbi:MAG: molybdenum cofactor guanylyltransferase [Archaeoglobaceae archaeon]
MKVAVLAGGRGKRLGGVEKAEIELCGMKLIEIAARKFDNAYVVCRDEAQAAKFSKYMPALVDEYRDFGVVAAIHAALKNIGDCVVVAVDMPFVKPEIVRRLWNLADCDALIPITDRPQPLLAFYSASLVEVFEEAIRRGTRRILDVVSGRAEFVSADVFRDVDPDLISFFNVNTPSDLVRAEELCGELRRFL